MHLSQRFFQLLTASALLVSHGAWAQAPGLVSQAPHTRPDTTGSPRIVLDGPVHRGPLVPVYVDGELRDSTVLSKLRPDDIAKIDMVKPGATALLGTAVARRGALFITTRSRQFDPAVLALNQRVAGWQQQAGGSAPGTTTRHERTSQAVPAGQPRYYLNGRPLPEGELRLLDPQSIDRIEVLKNHAAARYAGDSTVTGVFLLYTKQPTPAKPRQRGAN